MYLCMSSRIQNNMLDTAIPFEIHITTDSFPIDRQAEFINFCATRTAKPLMIELSQGDFIHQPMYTQVVHAHDFDQVLSFATDISNALSQQSFGVKRLKIEIPSDHFELFQDHSTMFDRYFEWHCKINYTQTEQLLQRCEAHKVHLSLNSLKNEPNIRFVTLREYGTKGAFEQRKTALLHDLQNGGWTTLKQQSEYCIYDNNDFLDHGWLPQ